MLKWIATLLLFVVSFSLNAQKSTPGNTALPRPKLVVGIMIDQMRWDYLYRYYDRYSNNGFKRMMGEGNSCENTMIPYAQTVTAAGHACVYTGSVPAFNGIMGNEWFDKSLNREVYCVEDKSVKIVGAEKGEPMSPANLWTTTICDELRLATNFKSKVIGIAMKDRGGILPAGHSANAAYWYDGGTGNWITSTWYMDQLPTWASSFNEKRWVDSFYRNDWNTLYPINTYVQSDIDKGVGEGKFGHEAAPVFPHELKSKTGKDYGIIRVTPFGNTLTLNFSKEALKAEQLGKDAITDILAISLSSPDYIGHQFGPNSIEAEDNYLRLDRDLGDFFAFLDKEVGKGQYTVFLTADHAVAHVPAFLREHKIATKTLTSVTAEMNKQIEAKFNVARAVRHSANYQLYLNDPVIDSVGADIGKIKEFIISFLNKQPDLLMAFDNANINAANLSADIKEKFLLGYNVKRAGDIQSIVKAGNFYGGATGTTHGSMYPYDAHIPLLWMGWGIKPGKLNREVYMTDIAATLAALLRIQMPSGNVGKVIPEVLK
ncbi:MAG: alkaline phosphatase family protein [Chitinophagaceae bacterium]|nr:alkaline phosphatase family protein [Chitinophagaceae bacterium]